MEILKAIYSEMETERPFRLAMESLVSHLQNPMNSDTDKFYQTSGAHSRSTRMNFQPKATETDSSNRAKQSRKITVVGLIGGRGVPKTNDSLCKVVAHIF